MTIHRDLTNIIFLYKLFLQTYNYYIQVGFLREFFKKEISENQGIFKTRNFEKECFGKSRNLRYKGIFYKTRNSKTREF